MATPLMSSRSGRYQRLGSSADWPANSWTARACPPSGNCRRRRCPPMLASRIQVDCGRARQITTPSRSPALSAVAADTSRRQARTSRSFTRQPRNCVRLARARALTAFRTGTHLCRVDWLRFL